MEDRRSPFTGGFDRRTVLRGAAALGAGALAGPMFIARARAQSPDTLRFGLSSYPPGIKPWENKGTASSTVKLQLYRGLVGYGADGSLQPELAESWEIPDAQTYVFKLRPNAVFQDGEAVTSADVKASLEAITAENSTAHMRASFGIIDSVDASDPGTVTIRLKEPSVTFIYLIAAVHAGIVSAKSLAADPENPVGAGPYRITENERGTSITMEAFDAYYKPGLPKSKTLKFVAYKDENLRVAAIEAGDVDIIEYVPWQAMESMGANPELALDVVDGPFMYLTFNTEQGPFADAKVRQAVAYGVRREDVIAAAFFGRGNKLGALPIPAGSTYHNPKFDGHWHYDPDKAKALLAESGHPDGFEATLLSTAQYGMHKTTAEVVQQNLAEIGINLKLNLPDWATRVALGGRGQYDIAVMGSAGDYNDPDALTQFLDSSQGTSYIRSVGFADPEINSLLDAGRKELDEAKRKEIYDRMHARALETVPLVSINWRAQGYATRASVEGFTNMPGFLTFYSGYSIENAAIPG